jgi:lysozyme
MSEEGRKQLTQVSEGLKLQAYPDPATKAAPWTIGYGHTKGVNKGDVCTTERAIYWLLEDLLEAENAVNRYVKVPLDQFQFDALVDFTFNVGVSNFANSTLLRRLNAGDYEGACTQFGRWVYGNNKIMPGLVTRRSAEVSWFIKGF